MTKKGKEQQRAAAKAARVEGEDEQRSQGRRGKRGGNRSLIAAGIGGVALAASLFGRLWPRQMAVLPVPRVALGEMSVERFLSEFSAELPVVLTGAWPEAGWRPAELAAGCPGAVIRTFKHDAASETWARQVQQGNMSLQDYVERFFLAPPAERPSPLLYGFEMELKKHCPQRLEHAAIPAFLSEDVFHLVSNGTGLGWPSVLLGPKGSETGLHIDTHRLPFWIAVVSPKGREGQPLKRFRIFPHKDTSLMKYGRPGKTANYLFDFDPWQPDYRRHSGLADSHVFETYLESGDLLYIPGGSPHAVINMEDNLAVSMNFLDLKTFPDFVRKCNAGSPLCGLLAGKGQWVLEALEERRQQRNNMNYFEFAGVQDAAGFCAANAQDMEGDPPPYPPLVAFCEGHRTSS